MGKLSYIRPLDGFRGLFCLLIVAYHWPLPHFSISFGWEVLQTFYVISGYLITRLLLHDKEKQPAFGTFISRFYYRRSFRIFPLYFGFVGFWILVYLLGFGLPFLHKYTEEVGRNWAYLLTYTYNFMGFFNHYLGINFESTHLFGHLWSLSLEEQYYITYPILVFFLSEKQLKYAVITAIIAGPLLRWGGYEWLMSLNPDHKWASVNLYRMAPFQVDSFAIGCLLALTGFERIKKPVRALAILLSFTFAVYMFNRWYAVAIDGTSFKAIGGNRQLEQWLTYNYQHVYLFTLVNFGAAFVVMCFERGHHLAGWLFNHKILAYFGKISYGIYVYHVPVLFFWMLFFTKTVPRSLYEQNSWLYEILAIIPFWILLLGISHLSYKYFEEYFLRWKERLDARKYAGLHEK